MEVYRNGCRLFVAVSNKGNRSRKRLVTISELNELCSKISKVESALRKILKFDDFDNVSRAILAIPRSGCSCGSDKQMPILDPRYRRDHAND